MKKIIHVLAILLTLSAPAFAAKPAPPSDLPPELLALLEGTKPVSTAAWPRFDTRRAAALYAAARLEKCSHYYECSGVIVVDPKGKFTVGPVRTDYGSDHVRITNEGVPSDWDIAADFHSHPCVPHHLTSVFSSEDIMGAIMTRTTSYMVDLCTGNVHEFVPGTSKPDTTKIDGQDRWLTGGSIIGQVAAFPAAPLAVEGI